MGRAAELARAPCHEESSLKEPFVSFDKFDLDNPIADREEIARVNPHRFELALLDAVVYIDDLHAVAYKDVGDDEFWVRGHFPGMPLMPGVLVVETAAQLVCFYTSRQHLRATNYLGLGGLDNVKFRAPVRPGDRLVVMLKRTRFRKNVMVVTEFQGFVNQQICAEGVIKGSVLPPPEELR